MRVLALDAALARCSAAVIVEQQTLAAREEHATRGHGSLLPVMADAVLGVAGLGAGELDLIAVTVGPGSFTGIRAALALAHGIACAAGVPLVGVTVGEALADALPRLGGRHLWCAIDSRRGRIFLERDGTIVAMPLEELPTPNGRIAVAGDAAPAVAARLAARDVDVMLTDARLPIARHIAVVGELRFAGQRGPLPPQPLYVDPPEARVPAGGLRPPPVG
jgi:tRNA threonylcarbamoyl adenosine modification protein YeaZ